MQLIRRLISRVHTKQDKHKSMKTEQCHTVKNTSCVPYRTRQNKRNQNKDNKCTWTKERTARANSRPHAPTARPNLERECPNPDTKPELGLKQDKSARNTTLQHETEHIDKRVHGSSTLEAARLPENKTRRECQCSVTKP